MPELALLGPPESNGGVGMYTSDLAEALSPAHVYRIDVGNHPFSHLALAVGAATAGCRTVHVQFVYQLFGSNGMFSYLFFSALWLATRVTDTRVVVTLHEVWTRDTVSNRVEWFYVRVMHRLLRLTTDRIVVLSERSREAFEESAPPGSAVVIPHGVRIDETRRVDAPKERFGFDEGSFLVTQHGYVNYRKRFDIFIEIARRMPDQQFMIAGGPRAGEFEELFEDIRRSAPDNVTITGTLDEGRFHAAFQASDLAVLPYDDIFQSGIFNWCAAYGVPTLASDIRYFVHLRRANGAPELFSDVEEAVELIRELREDEDARRALSERMAEYAERNSFETVVERNRELYA